MPALSDILRPDEVAVLMPMDEPMKSLDIWFAVFAFLSLIAFGVLVFDLFHYVIPA
jgi:hypothetical protein